MSGTSDIGNMYQAELQRRGIPLTPENMRRIVTESRANPDLIQGLRVQGEDAPQGGTQTPSPINSAPMPTPPIPPGGSPGEGAQTGNVQTLPPTNALPPAQTSAGIASTINTGGPATPHVDALPPPPVDDVGGAIGGSGIGDIASMIMSALGLGGAGAATGAAVNGRSSIGKPPTPATPMPPRQPFQTSGTAQDNVLRGGAPVQGPPIAPMGPPIAPMGPPPPPQGPPAPDPAQMILNNQSATQAPSYEQEHEAVMNEPKTETKASPEVKEGVRRAKTRTPRVRVP